MKYYLISEEEIENILKSYKESLKQTIDKNSYNCGFLQGVVFEMNCLKGNSKLIETQPKDEITELFHSTRPSGMSIGEFIESIGYKLIKIQ